MTYLVHKSLLILWPKFSEVRKFQIHVWFEKLSLRIFGDPNVRINALLLNLTLLLCNNNMHRNRQKHHQVIFSLNKTLFREIPQICGIPEESPSAKQNVHVHSLQGACRMSSLSTKIFGNCRYYWQHSADFPHLWVKKKTVVAIDSRYKQLFSPFFFPPKSSFLKSKPKKSTNPIQPNPRHLFPSSITP